MPIVITLDGTDDPEEVRAIGQFLSGYMRRDAKPATAALYGLPAPQADVAWGVADQNTLASLQKMRVEAVTASPPPTCRDGAALFSLSHPVSADDTDLPEDVSPDALETVYGYVAQPSDGEIDAAVAAAARSCGLQGETDELSPELDRQRNDDAMVVLAAAQMHYTLATDWDAAALIPPPPAVELDAKGQPWDPELHAASKAKVKDGTWRQRRNTGGIEPPPVAAGIIPPPPSAISPDDGAVSIYLAKALIERITQHLTNDPTQASAVLAAVQSVGLTKGFPQLTERPDLASALIEELGWGDES